MVVSAMWSASASGPASALVTLIKMMTGPAVFDADGESQLIDSSNNNVVLLSLNLTLRRADSYIRCP